VTGEHFIEGYARTFYFKPGFTADILDFERMYAGFFVWHILPKNIGITDSWDGPRNAVEVGARTTGLFCETDVRTKTD
jgi:hypothetical protein